MAGRIDVGWELACDVARSVAGATLDRRIVELAEVVAEREGCSLGFSLGELVLYTVLGAARGFRRPGAAVEAARAMLELGFDDAAREVVEAADVIEALGRSEEVKELIERLASAARRFSGAYYGLYSLVGRIVVQDLREAIEHGQG